MEKHPRPKQFHGQIKTQSIFVKNMWYIQQDWLSIPSVIDIEQNKGLDLERASLLS
jgi:hypothetical protein